MFGDPNQCEPVEGGSRVTYNYLTSSSVRRMCSETITLQYIEGTSRYDVKTNEMLTKFLKTGKVSAEFKPIDGKLYNNICYLNSTRIKVNTRCCNQFVKGKTFYPINFKYNNGTKKYKV